MACHKVQRRDFLRRASALTGAAATFGLSESVLSALPQAGSRSEPPTREAAKPQFSLAHLTVLGCAPPEMAYIAARAGYDFVSYRLIHMGLPGEPIYDLANNKEMLRQTKTALATTGLKLLDIEVARISDGLDPKKYLPAMEAAAELGGRYVLASIWASDRSFATECFAGLCDLARPLGLSVVLEFVTLAVGKSLAAVMAVLRDARRPNSGVLVDTLHFSCSRVSLDELDAVPRDWFHFAHVCDGPSEIPTTAAALAETAREARLYPDEGGIDIAAILNRMPQVPYSLEIPNLARVKELGYAEHAWRCLEATRTYLAAHLRACQ